MKTLTKIFAFAIPMAILTVSCSPKPAAVELFNGSDLTGWVGYLAADSLDSATEFTVRDGVIRLSGKLGYIYTEQSYSDYKLEVEWRWPETATNSGIFLRLKPSDQPFPQSFECQLMAGNAGDLIAVAGASSDETTSSGETNIPKMNPSNEKPVGEWNLAEITCNGGEITVSVNGTLQNRINGASLSEGRIGLQSEGEAIEFRNIRVTPLK